MSKEEPIYQGSALGCGCIILAIGIALFLFGISVNAVEIVKIIWK